MGLCGFTAVGESRERQTGFLSKEHWAVTIFPCLLLNLCLYYNSVPYNIPAVLFLCETKPVLFTTVATSFANSAWRHWSDSILWVLFQILKHFLNVEREMTEITCRIGQDALSFLGFFSLLKQLSGNLNVVIFSFRIFIFESIFNLPENP